MRQIDGYLLVDGEYYSRKTEDILADLEDGEEAIIKAMISDKLFDMLNIKRVKDTLTLSDDKGNSFSRVAYYHRFNDAVKRFNVVCMANEIIDSYIQDIQSGVIKPSGFKYGGM